MKPRRYFFILILIGIIFLINRYQIQKHSYYVFHELPINELPINESVSILNSPYNYVRAYDQKFLYNVTIRQKAFKLAIDVYHDMVNNDFNKTFFYFASSIWIEEYKLYFSVVRFLRLSKRQTNALYITTHDINWNERTEPFIYGTIKTPQILPLYLNGTHINNGPCDPRVLFDHNNDLIIVFNMLLLNKIEIRRMHTYNIRTGKLTILNSESYNQKFIQKNWGQIIIKNKLYYVYDFYDFKLLDCDENGQCKFLKPFKQEHSNSISMVRCGTPFVNFKLNTEYYFGLVFEHSSERKYRPRLAIIHAANDDALLAKVIYVSDTIEFKIQENINTVVVISPSIAHIDYENDVTTVTVYFEDRYNFSYKVKGLIQFILERIEVYKTDYKIDLSVASMTLNSTEFYPSSQQIKFVQNITLN